jgi:hypothetical protein
LGRKQGGQQQGQQDQGGDDALFEQGFSRKKGRQAKKAANWAAHQAVMSHGTKFKLKPP